MNTPNRITLLRIILVPVFIIALIQNLTLIPFIIFIVCMVSDGLDGFIARRYNQKTQLGIFLDPTADKLLLVSAYLTLAVIGDIPWWLTVVVLLRDIILVAGWLILYVLTDSTIIAPRIIGKMTTFFQMTTVILVLFSKYYITIPWLIGLFYITGTFTILSALDYFVHAKKTSSAQGMLS